MACTVVCFSASDGAAGEDIAPRVASRLGFALIDEQIIARAAEEAGVQHQVVADVERRKTLVARVLEHLPAAGVAIGTSAFTGIPPIRASDLSPDGDRLRGLIRAAIEEIAGRGEVVIVAHAAGFALPARPDVLRVLVTASSETRRRRIAEDRGLDEREAMQRVTTGDTNRADYLKRFYRVASEEPWHYDLVLNTDRRSPEQSADVIVQAARG